MATDQLGATAAAAADRWATLDIVVAFRGTVVDITTVGAR